MAETPGSRGNRCNGVEVMRGLVEIRSRRDGPRYLHGVLAVLDNSDDGMTPDAVAKAYQIDVRLVMGVKQFAKGSECAHPVR